jgi:hypothetical protein
METSATRNYPLSGGYYRRIASLDTPWVASPIIADGLTAFDGLPWNPIWVQEALKGERARRLGTRPSAKGASRSFWSYLKNLFSAFCVIFE